MTIDQMLEEFHRKHDVMNHKFTEEQLWELRTSLLLQELVEYFVAVASRDLEKAVDALADMAYVIFGSAQQAGVNLTEVIEEVHRSNMSKDVGASGKAIKGPNYIPPNIRKFLPQTRSSFWTKP